MPGPPHPETSRERGFVGPKDIDRVREVRQTEERFLASDVFEERSRALPPNCTAKRGKRSGGCSSGVSWSRY